MISKVVDEPMRKGDTESTEAQFAELAQKHKDIQVLMTDFEGNVTYSTNKENERKPSKEVLNHAECSALVEKSLKEKQETSELMQMHGTPYFTENPGDRFRAWDVQLAADWSPQPFVTFRAEYNHRAANVPYFSGPGGVTPPGGNQGALGSTVDGWSPDLVKTEDRLTMAMLVKF